MMMGLMQLLQISTCVLDKADNTSNSYFQRTHPHPCLRFYFYVIHLVGNIFFSWCYCFSLNYY